MVSMAPLTHVPCVFFLLLHQHRWTVATTVHSARDIQCFFMTTSMWCVLAGWKENRGLQEHEPTVCRCANDEGFARGWRLDSALFAWHPKWCEGARVWPSWEVCVTKRMAIFWKGWGFDFNLRELKSNFDTIKYIQCFIQVGTTVCICNVGLENTWRRHFENSILVWAIFGK